MDKIIELAKKAGAVSYTNRHYPDRPYRTFGPEELQKFYTIARADLEAENAKLRQALERVYVTCDWHGDDGRDAMQAAYTALGETK